VQTRILPDPPSPGGPGDGYGEGRHRPSYLAGHAHGFPAGGENPEVRARVEQCVHQACRPLHDVLAVVEHQQHALPWKNLADGIGERLAGPFLDAQNPGARGVSGDPGRERAALPGPRPSSIASRFPRPCGSRANAYEPPLGQGVVPSPSLSSDGSLISSSPSVRSAKRSPRHSKRCITARCQPGVSVNPASVLLAERGVDLVVLACYMQVLSPVSWSTAAARSSSSSVRPRSAAGPPSGRRP
jgi:hypothetical protein